MLSLVMIGLAVVCLCAALDGAGPPERRPHLQVRGIYGGVPAEIFERGERLQDYGVNAIWIGSGGLTAAGIARLREEGARVFAEFNTLHDASYLKTHPDAAPVGTDGAVCPPPSGWQGVCPTHPGYRSARMAAFRAVLQDHPVDGIWLDYHHAHANWEQAVPELPDTCFCRRCLEQFARETGTPLPDRPTHEVARLLLGERRAEWVRWRCGVFTSWVREFRAIRDQARPAALLGTFHCPWTDTEFDGALRDKLAIDLRAQAPYFDVLSPMPYHARFGHASDPAWISRQTSWLDQHLRRAPAVQPVPRIWPIVQLADWGEPVPAAQVAAVLDHGTRPPATGVMVFAWSGLREHWDRVAEMGRWYRAAARAE